MHRSALNDIERSKLAWPLSIIIGLMPLIVRLREIKIPEVVKDIWDNGSGTYGDFFSANKLIALVISTIIGLIILTIYFIKDDIKEVTLSLAKMKSFKVIMISLSTYLIMSVLSTILAEKGLKILSLFGAPGRYEGLIAIICYVSIMILAIYNSKGLVNVRLLYKSLIIGATIMGLIGVGQFFGIDFFQTEGGKALILPYKYLGLADQINFAFQGRSYATLFNPNYVGSYTAILIPIAAIRLMYIYTYGDKLSQKILATIFLILMVALCLLSYSRGGLIGATVGILLILLLSIKNIKKLGSKFIYLIVFLAISLAIFNFTSKGIIGNRIKSLSREMNKLFDKEAQEIKQLENIILEKSSVTIMSNLPDFKIEQDNEKLILKDSNDELIPVVEEDIKIIPSDDKFNGLSITNNLPEGFKVIIYNPQVPRYYHMDFVMTKDGIKILGTNESIQDIYDIDSWGFKGKENLGSNRGYIWSRTIPMIKDTWLLGYGPDTYVVKFPQHDVIGKINSIGTVKIVVDKPHNLYLQTIVSTGAISMLALVILFITYVIIFITSIKDMGKDDIKKWFSIGIFASICGYLVSGLFNDSVVSVAPLFWILWGTGIGIALFSKSNNNQLVK